jgi:glycosyltransferase involved in cell wall biosynthesis
MYNAERFADGCLMMLTSQSLNDIELIVVDDGSTDGTAKVLEGWSRREQRLYVISQRNTGAGIARNVGLDVASGRYVVFADVDDSYDRTYLEALHASASQAGSDVAVCRSRRYDCLTQELTDPDWVIRQDLLPDSQAYSGSQVRDVVFQAFVGWTWDKLFRLDFIKDSGLRFPALRNSEDGVFVFMALCLAERITTIQDRLVLHQVNRPSSISSSLWLDQLCFFEAIRLIRDDLRGRGLYDAFERSFIEWSLHYSLWNYDRAVGQKRSDLADFLTGTAAPELAWDRLDATAFNNQDEYGRLLELMGQVPRGGRLSRDVLACGKLFRLLGRLLGR